MSADDIPVRQSPAISSFNMAITLFFRPAQRVIHQPERASVRLVTLVSALDNRG